jgi:hypothetical protein
MRRLRCLTAVLLAAGVCLQANAQRTSHDFEGHAFNLDLPPGYVFQSDQSPRPGFTTFGFSTDPRQDGSRGMIQVSLLNLSGAPAGEKVTLERFAEAMIKGVSLRRSRWEQTDSDVKIAGVRGKRIDWAGSVEPGFGRPAVNMRGVMIVGIKNNVGFSLHTQDLAGFADTTLPLCEQALQTFALTLRR